MINVLQIIAPATIGGAENVILAIDDLIRNDMFHLHFCLFVNPRKGKNALLERLGKRGCTVATVLLDRPWLDFIYIFRLIRILRRLEIDLIHSHGYLSDFFALVASKITRTPIVTTVHGWTASSRMVERYEYCHRSILRYFDHVIAVSRAIRAVLYAKKVPPRRITLLHNVINHRRFSGADLNLGDTGNLREAGTGPVLGVVGRLSQEKGHVFLLRAMRRLTGEFPEIRLIVIGDGDQEDHLKRYVDAHGMGGRVFFLGYQEDVRPYYRLMDIFILPSLTEGIPLVLLEALYYSVPVIASDVGGVGELIRDGSTGLLLPARDVDALAKKVVYLLGNRHYAQKLAKNGHDMVMTDYNADAWIRKIENIYSTIGAKGPSQ